MKKYEPAGGVCALEWKAGSPSGSDEFGQIIFETWRSANPNMWMKIPSVSIYAALDAASWNYDKWDTLSGRNWDRNNVRRWARLSSNFTALNICVADWEL